ncbi:MAG: hypothetical protein OEL89_04545, partial [Candidatus Peregrinibacteria bacterium]|nr:hypothetical protein [Candidatus Peregrinibacteria bacterium]
RAKSEQLRQDFLVKEKPVYKDQFKFDLNVAIGGIINMIKKNATPEEQQRISNRYNNQAKAFHAEVIAAGKSMNTLGRTESKQDEINANQAINKALVARGGKLVNTPKTNTIPTPPLAQAIGNSQPAELSFTENQSSLVATAGILDSSISPEKKEQLQADVRTSLVRLDVKKVAKRVKKQKKDSLLFFDRSAKKYNGYVGDRNFQARWLLEKVKSFTSYLSDLRKTVSRGVQFTDKRIEEYLPREESKNKASMACGVVNVKNEVKPEFDIDFYRNLMDQVGKGTLNPKDYPKDVLIKLLNYVNAILVNDKKILKTDPSLKKIYSNLQRFNVEARAVINRALQEEIYAKPSIRDTMSAIAHAVYEPDVMEIKGTGFKKLSSAKLAEYGLSEDILNNEDTGLQTALYSDGKTVVVAFAGTDPTDWLDWLTNLLQGTGFDASQYKSVKTISDIIRDNIGNKKLVFSGHSLGGGLAAAAGAVTKAKTYTFNAAGVHPNTLRTFGVKEYEFCHIKNYVTDEEFLTYVQKELRLMPEAIGQQNYEGSKRRDALINAIPSETIRNLVRIKLHSVY